MTCLEQTMVASVEVSVYTVIASVISESVSLHWKKSKEQLWRFFSMENMFWFSRPEYYLCFLSCLLLWLGYHKKCNVDVIRPILNHMTDSAATIVERICDTIIPKKCVCELLQLSDNLICWKDVLNDCHLDLRSYLDQTRVGDYWDSGKTNQKVFGEFYLVFMNLLIMTKESGESK